MCPFDYTAVAVSRKIERLQTGLITPVRWLLLLQLTVLIQSAIVVQSKLLVALLFSMGVGAFVKGLSQISSFSCYQYAENHQEKILNAACIM